MKNKFARLHFLYWLLLVSAACFLGAMLLLYIRLGLRDIDDEFSADASMARNYIRDQLIQNETILIGLGSLLKGRDDLDIDALDAYSSTMMQRFSHIAMFQIALRMDAQAVPAYRQIMRAHNIAAPSIVQFGGGQLALNSPQISNTLPVIFVSPESSKAVLGLDLSSIDFIQQALPSAGQAEITLSEPIELLEGDNALVMMLSCPPTKNHAQGYVSLLLVRQSMLLLKKSIDAKWSLSIVAKPPRGKAFVIGEQLLPALTRTEGYFFHRVVVSEDIHFAQYQINVQLSKDVSWQEINLWQLALWVVLSLAVLAAILMVYCAHLSSERRRARQQKNLFRQANYDSLTQLANRFYFEDSAQRVLSNAQRQQEGVLLLFVDLNGFKAINDTLGHDAGDRVLQAVARSLLSVLRQSDLVARLGGDEFAILIHGIADLTAVLNMMEKVRMALASLQVDGVPTDKVSGSVGFAFTLQHGYDLAKLLKIADNSMYGEKSFYQANYPDSH